MLNCWPVIRPWAAPAGRPRLVHHLARGVGHRHWHRPLHPHAAIHGGSSVQIVCERVPGPLPQSSGVVPGPSGVVPGYAAGVPGGVGLLPGVASGGIAGGGGGASVGVSPSLGRPAASILPQLAIGAGLGGGLAVLGGGAAIVAFGFPPGIVHGSHTGSGNLPPIGARPIHSVPEPGSAAILAVSVAALALARRRRK